MTDAELLRLELQVKNYNLKLLVLLGFTYFLFRKSILTEVNRNGR